MLDRLPRSSLLGPNQVPDDLTERPLGDGLFAVYRLEKQNLFLDVWREQREVEQLGELGPREPKRSSSFCLILVFTTIELSLDVMSERQHLGNASRSAPRLLLRWWWRDANEGFPQEGAEREGEQTVTIRGPCLDSGDAVRGELPNNGRSIGTWLSHDGVLVVEGFLAFLFPGHVLRPLL